MALMSSTGQKTTSRTTMSAIRSRAPIFVPLLVLALLICHGVLGSPDHSVVEPASSVAVHQLQGESGAPGSSGEHPVEHPPAHGYYVVAFLTVLIGAFLGLLFRGALPTVRITLPFRQIQQNFASPILYSGSRLTPNLLQVFRL